MPESPESWELHLLRVGDLFFCSKSLISLSYCERFALSLFKKEWPWANVANDKRTTVRDTLRSLMTKEQHEWFARFWGRLAQKIYIFHMFFIVFHCFYPLLCPRANHLNCSSLSPSFLKSNGSDLLFSIFTKEWLRSNHSPCPSQQSDCERFAQVAHDKRATGAIRSFSRANRFFTYKKRAILSKKRWVNSPPCIFSSMW